MAATTQILQVKKLSEQARLPERKTPDAAGYDIYAAEKVKLWEFERAKVRTHLQMSLPPGTYGQLESRSSLASEGIIVIGGVIDCDYRGEVMVILQNLTKGRHVINIGDRIAQLLVLPVFAPHVVLTDVLSETERGDKGFGSTGR